MAKIIFTILPINHLHGVGDREPDDAGGERVAAVEGEDGGEEDDDVAEDLDPDAEPPVRHVADVVAHQVPRHLRLRLLEEPGLKI